MSVQLAMSKMQNQYASNDEAKKTSKEMLPTERTV